MLRGEGGVGSDLERIRALAEKRGLPNISQLLVAVDIYKDCKLGKNKHYNAKRRMLFLAKVYEILAGAGSFALTVGLTLKALNIVTNVPLVAAIAVSAVSTAATLISLVQKYHLAAIEHSNAGDEFLALERKSAQLVGEMADTAIGADIVKRTIDRLTEEYTEIVKRSVLRVTNNQDLQHARSATSLKLIEDLIDRHPHSSAA